MKGFRNYFVYDRSWRWKYRMSLACCSWEWQPARDVPVDASLSSDYAAIFRDTINGTVSSLLKRFGARRWRLLLFPALLMTFKAPYVNRSRKWTRKYYVSLCYKNAWLKRCWLFTIIDDGYPLHLPRNANYAKELCICELKDSCQHTGIFEVYVVWWRYINCLGNYVVT